MSEEGKYSDIIESLNLRRALNKFSKIDNWIRYCMLQLKFILENLNDPTILE